MGKRALDTRVQEPEALNLTTGRTSCRTKNFPSKYELHPHLEILSEKYFNRAQHMVDACQP